MAATYGLKEESGASSQNPAADQTSQEEKTWRIGEVAEMLNMETSALRYWQTQFPQINPLRTERGQRLYTSQSIKVLRKIKELLYNQGMTIEGARKILDSDPVPRAPQDFLSNRVVAELEELRKLLSTGKLL